MRIVGGKYRGRKITEPTNQNIRPTSDRARESLFNILTHSKFGGLLNGKTVLDVFAGTGALGFEALSRGAREVYFIEQSRRVSNIIKTTAGDLQELDNIKLLTQDATQLGEAVNSFDLILMDAPYLSGQSELSLRALVEGGWLRRNCICCIEIGKQETLQAGNEFEMLDRRYYGAAQFIILRWNG